MDGSLGELGRLALEVERFCRENALAGEFASDVNLALEELFTNAVRHGGCEGLKGAVRVRLERDGDEIRVEFSDRGREFDPLAATPPDVAAPLRDRPVGGLGLHLVRQTMGQLEYWRSGEWNHVRMRRPA